MLKVAHITDLHLGEVGQVYLGLDHYQRFLAVLEDAQFHEPDLYILGGDYALHEPNSQVCTWLRNTMDETGRPYLVLAGNHDDSAQLSMIFDLKLHNGRLDFTCQLNGQQHIFLDTSLGTVDHDQLKWLRHQLEHENAPVLWMHHPPCPIGADFMDHKHGMKDWKPLMAVLQATGRPLSVFTGHYHANLRFRTDNVQVYTSPPTSFFISPSASEFIQEDYPPAYQLVLLGNNRELVIPKYVNHFG